MRLRSAGIPCILIVLLLGCIMIAADITTPEAPAYELQRPGRNVQSTAVILPPYGGNYNTQLVLLGTTGGIGWWADTTRASTSSALLVGDTIYIIDLGQGSTARLAEAFVRNDFVLAKGGRIENGSSISLQKVKAVFFTHLHQDHTADYPAFLLIGPGAGLGMHTNPVTGKTDIVPVRIFGPGARGELEADKTNYLNRSGTIVETYDGQTSPGLRQMTALIWQAYAQTINDMTLDNGYPDFTRLVTITELGGSEPGDIPIPADVPDPNADTCPAMEPFAVYSDENIQVTAILVNHSQVYPSFAYRFDTPDASIVFSGDTGIVTNGNLQRLANGADILVHEVIDEAWIDVKFGTPAEGTQMAALKIHMQNSHTKISDVGRIAEECNVSTLVLNHIVPGNTPKMRLMQAQQNFSGKLIIGEDLMRIGIRKFGRPW